MNLIISSNPINNKGEATPEFQDWGPLPNPFINEIFYFPNLGLVPVMETIVFKIKDFFPLPTIYPIRLWAYQSYHSGNTINWVNPTSYMNLGYPNAMGFPIALVENNKQFSFTPVLQNLNLLTPGQYSFYHYFKVQVLQDGNWLDLGSASDRMFEYRIRLTVKNQPVFISPSNILMRHTYGNPLPARGITISGDNWTVVGDPKIILSSSSMGSVVTQITDATGTYQKVTNTSGISASLSIQLSDFYDQIGVFDPTVLQIQLKVIAGTSTIVGYINISVEVLMPDTLILSPNTLMFNATKGFSEAPAQQINFLCAGDYIISASPWLITEIREVTVQGVTSEKLFVHPIPTLNMSAGIYTGFVSLTSIINGVEQTLTTDVIYNLSDFIQSPYQQDEIAFTLDQKFFQLSSSNTDVYFQVTSLITTFDFFTNNQKQFPIAEKFIPFNGSAKFNIGTVIHALMNRFDNVNSNDFQCAPAKLELSVAEKKISDSSVIREISAYQVLFVAGLGRNMSGSGFLEFNPKAKRVLSTSYAYLNILLDGSFKLATKKNGVEISSVVLFSQGPSIVCKKFSFANNVEGDVIEYLLLDQSDAIVSSKTYIVFPVQRKSNLIVWENEFLLQDVVDCTGGFSIKSEFITQSQKLYTNLVEALEILDTTKDVKLIINTGWLLNTDIDSIESLMMAKRAWLDHSNGTINLRPVAKSIVNVDSDRELIEYAIEFEINKKYGQETYTL